MTYDKIEVLGNLEAIRKVPSMYIGSTDTPIHLFHELFCNSLDEAINLFATDIDIYVNDDNSLTITDDGRGFPIYFDEKENEWSPIVACTRSHAGGKFNKEAYVVSGGLHGLGITCCTALCSSLSIHTYREGTSFRAHFNNGIHSNPEVVKTGKGNHGTEITILPSGDYFKSVSWDLDIIRQRCRLARLFVPHVSISLNGENIAPPSSNELIHKFDGDIFEVKCKTKNGESAHAIFGYSLTRTERNFSGAVNLLPVSNGLHVRLLERALSDAWTSVVDASTRDYLSASDYIVGLSGFILCNLLNPSYSSQTKETLTGSLSDYKDLQASLKDAVQDEIKKRLQSKFIQTLLHRFRDYRKSQNEMNSSKYLDEVIKYGDTDSSGISRGAGLSSKLVDCRTSDRESSELFICEGNSAGGNLIARRDPKTQAVLPLRGKTLNVIDQDLKRILSNLEIRSLINSLGVGVLHKEIPERIRYGKIIIAADSDDDGSQIQALLLGALCYLVPGVVQMGRVYIADAPLFGQIDKKKGFIPVWNQSDLKKGLETFRYKGLGSMDTNEIEMTLLNHKTRKIHQVFLDDANKVLQIVGKGSYKKDLLVERGLLQF